MTDKTFELNMSLPPVFQSDIQETSKYIKKFLNLGWEIHICSNFPAKLLSFQVTAIFLSFRVSDSESRNLKITFFPKARPCRFSFT
mgnify:CR=1 FL=1